MKHTIAAFLTLCAFAHPAFALEQEACQEKIVEGQRLGLIKTLANDGGAIVVIVDENAYSNSSYDAKVGIAKNLQCAIVGPNKVLVDIQFRSHKSKKLLAQWNAGDLSVK
ncbi:hypothetical protein [Rhizobium sp. RM]|uniref:hypothetical protein n=1 Tax=Rhizobium sp. RM TaxID=2748079 RepID=UPI00110E0029|nr:hypothetical protein [Rhizobium sp. RM]NWJ24748.1 hypothetical protein [Rhizobium sp. RM]TMV16548.1 hypothetical protein BJG94_19105 [Rhizobium sp. Td3]